jgi:hypothetical protein
MRLVRAGMWLLYGTTGVVSHVGKTRRELVTEAWVWRLAGDREMHDILMHAANGDR